MSNPNDYTVGWICALTTEFVAAQAFLDEEHEGPQAVAQNDNNNYALGKIGNHNIVIAVLPDKEYGTAVARDMLHSFPNIRIGLMVGIGGGAPSPNHDIRLGDIVVSSRDGGKGGVFQYDFGKTIKNRSFQETGFLDQPPTVLRAAVNALKGRYELKGHLLNDDVEMALKKIKKRKKYSRPPASSDRLYRSDITHPSNSSEDCSAVCGDDSFHLVARAERDEEDDNPAIHYGLIASANQLMKDALVRDKLAAEKGVLCFEMEAAGLMNHFPCLVIRGICDYSDSHKNKQWQGFAAMMAAAFAKDLLHQVAPNRVEAERTISDILSGFQEIAQQHRDVSKEHRDIAREQLQAQKDLARERLSEEQQRCHQLFRLTTSSKDATYEWYKDRVEERVEGTCLWFLKHDHFQTWLDQESGPLLVSADPGCGKSVLAKYLIDHGLPQSATICYFFFKDQDQNTVKQALCALLHQLFSLKPLLIEHAMPQFRKDGQGLINSTESLWKILRNAIRDSQSGPVIIVLDALDECAESEFADLMRNVESQFRSDRLGYGKLKYLLTCRPYDQILSKFRVLLEAFPNIHIPGEEESKTISQEVNHVIRHRIDQLAIEKRFTAQIKHHLEKRLQEATHRTYLWVYLVFDYLQKHDFKKTLKGIESAVTTLPTSVNEAYEQILNKANKDPMIPKVLRIILAASRPLTLSEMNVAVNIDDKCQSIDDLDLEDDEDFKARLRSWCGLFVSIHQDSIYFLHQTAREFLLADLASPKTVLSELRWNHFTTTRDAHAVLAKLCVLYLNFFNSNASLLTDIDGAAGYDAGKYPLLDYSAETWGTHFREAGFMDDDSIVPLALRICDTASKSYSLWFRIYWETLGRRTTKCFTDLMIASFYGHYVIVKLLLDKGAEIEAKDSEYGQTPLSWAAGNGRDAVVKLLLDKGVKTEVKDGIYGQTPLSWAAGNGRDAVVKLLLGKGAKTEAKDNGDRTPLSWTARNGHDAVVKLLLDKGAEVDVKDKGDRTPLSWAARNGHDAVVKLLLDKGAEVDVKDKGDRTPLSWAAGNGHEAIVKLLLDKGAKTEVKDSIYGQTPLSWAARNGHDAVVKLLLDKGAEITITK
ncbi:hypothetical protein FPOA_12708 [Fusarium poae]|uniref:Uncharacterized protein n=1 Tax=Fusarium poae TaxID=36050 RepID=A0A1B8A859_FUSPO|nr:hypothetical protein FPOA_12708 [Fusarium poae]